LVGFGLRFVSDFIGDQPRIFGSRWLPFPDKNRESTMADASRPATGTIGWTDLTVDDARTVREFYASVVGWTFEDVDMGGYSDFTALHPTSGDAVGGVCHARGSNADLPPVWMIYVNVDDLDTSIERCVALGGEVISGPKQMGTMGRYCAIKDPAGAIMSLFEPS